ncbi:hypothetical protein VTN96DRAFT_9786 [Rasamsonia emersonii]
MDKKTTALLKLIYLEMFGYDMSWASFHVLEVMSSAKYLQKRVGYLAAAQSFRADTEVLMLATNLLKKDIVSSSVLNLSLPLATLPHIITPSLAMSLLSDLLPRLSHSNATVRKKTVVSLYRLALVYPEALRLAWPKIKERLMDSHEDSSVTAAVINVVCELGWRRPRDFLPLAPRFFELLVDGGNNWMAIKIIKLFATLTPLEPRLVRKLLRPLTNIIQTTTAMSLLYECINGIIQGGILDEAEGIQEGDEVASLCVAKLRGMIAMDADPNLKYVALLAFNRIVLSHPALVAMQQDVIMDCLDDPDISIRLQALELAVQMVSSETLQLVVDRLIAQLQHSSVLDSNSVANPIPVEGLKSSADVDYDGMGEALEPHERKIHHTPPLPNEYRNEVIHKILDICSHDNYSDIVDFEWYVNILIQLVRLVPPSNTGSFSDLDQQLSGQVAREADIASRIGAEIRNVAVRVKSVRLEATRAAESFLSIDDHANPLSMMSSSRAGILGPAAWVVGEYAEFLAFPDRTLHTLIATNNISLPGRTLSLYLQAIPKVFLHLISGCHDWNAARLNECSLLLTRVISFLEALATHPDLDVQERTIEFLELLRLTKEAINPRSSEFRQLPFLLTSVIPSLFSGLELNPVAINAQKKVPLPENLDLNQAMNDKLQITLNAPNSSWLDVGDHQNFQDFYYIRDSSAVSSQREASLKSEQRAQSYQDTFENSPQEPGSIAKRGVERRDRNRDDPFYIGNDEESSGRSTPLHQVFTASNGEELDIDSIPIIDLAIDSEQKGFSIFIEDGRTEKKHRSRSERVEIATDETFGIDGSPPTATRSREIDDIGKPKRSLLQVDSSRIGHFSLNESDQLEPMTAQEPGKEEDDAEMMRAMQEVERLRLEMQRASERINARGIPADGTLVKKKGKKKKKQTSNTQSQYRDEALRVDDDDIAGKSSLGQGKDPKLISPRKKRKKHPKRIASDA